jgi:hypothetical protein
MMMIVRHSFSAFTSEDTPLSRENQHNYIHFDSLNPQLHYPTTHDSNIPEFQHPNWGKVPDLFVYITGELTQQSLNDIRPRFTL